MNQTIHAELWTSWASLLHSYAAAHGLNTNHQCVIEVGPEEIILRVDARWVRFTHSLQLTSEATGSPFALNEDGTVTIGSSTREMDMAAEEITRQLLRP